MNNFQLEPGMKLEPGAKVIIRRDIMDDDFGITNASEYRGREMTISAGGNPNYKLLEDSRNWWWSPEHFEFIYYPDSCDDPHVDSSFDMMLSEF